MSRREGLTCVIRPAEPGDLPSIVEFNRRLALETESKTLDLGVLKAGVERALADPDRARYWVAEMDNPTRIVGQAAITQEWSDWRNGWVWWFQSVYIAQEERGRGLFRLIHQHIRTLAYTDPDVVGLRLYVEEANHSAQAVYRALGMRPGGYHVFEDLWIARPRDGDEQGPGLDHAR